MEIKETDHRVYVSEYGLPTIQLGCGGVIISDLKFEGDDFSGIGFSLGAGEVGEDHKELEGKNAIEASLFFQIIATKPESLQVVIDKLLLAKANLESKTP